MKQKNKKIIKIFDLLNLVFRLISVLNLSEIWENLYFITIRVPTISYQVMKTITI